MSELLLRGWNVAVPVVDVGDDVFVINDDDKTTWRVQVKSARAKLAASTGAASARFNLSRAQLRRIEDPELFFMLMVRDGARWRFLVVPRERMLEIHQRYVNTPWVGPGRRPISSDDAKTDKLGFDVVIDAGDAYGWNTSLTEFLDAWPPELPVLGGRSVRGGKLR